MIVLGIESTAHTFGIGIVQYDNKSIKVLSNIRDSYTTESGGMIPAKVADHHVDVSYKVIDRAMKEASVDWSDIDVISVANAPGIGHTLRIGVFLARFLALKYNKPLIPVNHCIAHLEIGRVSTDAKDPVLLYASGANTQVIAYESGKYRVFGETLDIGIGNFLDNLARLLGLGFPGGPLVEKMARKGKRYIELPYVVKGMDISLGGILTNIKQKILGNLSSNTMYYDICYSAQETVFSMLVEITERAMAHTGKREVLLGGGVACNKRLQEMIKIMAKERGAKAFILPNEYNVDNGAMIAATAALMNCSNGIKSPESVVMKPYERTDDVDVFWR